MAGPDWLGIGVTRGGTTWFTNMLTQHPQVDLPDGTKELHILQRERVDLDKYRALFADGDRTGEFTPRYMRSLISVPRVRRVLPDEAPILVLLRDPIDRFESVMRLRAQRGNNINKNFAQAVSDHIWTGMYADQLDVWTAALGRDRLVIMQFEAIRTDPQAAVDRVWKMLGLDPIPLHDVDRPSHNISRKTWEWPRELREHLTAVYTPQVYRVADRYGIDPTRWKNFAHTV